MTNDSNAPKLSARKPWAERLRAVWPTYSEYGPANTLAIIIRAIFPEWMLSGQACLVLYRGFPEHPQGVDAESGVRPFQPEDQPRIAHFDNSSWDYFKQMPKEDWDGFILEVAGEPVATTWFHRHQFSPFPWVNFTLPEEAIAHCNHVVNPPHRRKGYPTTMRNFALRQYIEEGFTCYFSSIDTINTAARRFSAKTGSEIVGRLWYTPIH